MKIGMAPKLIRKQCPWCKRVFNTYDLNMEFCSTVCQGKQEYVKSGLPDPPKQPKEFTCLLCNRPSSSSYCSFECKRLASRVPEEKRKERGGRINKNPLPYDVLNKIEERKRVLDEKFAENFIRYGRLKDRI